MGTAIFLGEGNVSVPVVELMMITHFCRYTNTVIELYTYRSLWYANSTSDCEVLCSVPRTTLSVSLSQKNC